MTELILLALLLWLWVIERRLHAMSVTVRTLKLDLEGLRASRDAERRGSSRQATTDEEPQPLHPNVERIPVSAAAHARPPVH